ncbi:MAG: imidazolonepropionase [Phycisphaerales bacterium]|nr:MAG: imidazolonepropionase [Phycisphaerales bacterium]
MVCAMIGPSRCPMLGPTSLTMSTPSANLLRAKTDSPVPVAEESDMQSPSWVSGSEHDRESNGVRHGCFSRRIVITDTVPDMFSALIHNARLITLAGPDEPRRGDAMRSLSPIDRGYIAVDDEGRIAQVEPGDPPGEVQAPHVIDAQGRVVLPAFVDCHTHACWAGERYDEFEQRLAGASYLDILKSGGGIMATVRAVRHTSEDELLELLRIRTGRMIALGTGACEIKSGYGLDTDTELKMLRAIDRLRRESPLRIKATFLGAHALDPDQPDFIERTINETLPAVAREFPGITCDAYCEEGAWSLEETRRLFEAALAHDLPLRVHADQFNALGMTSLAVEMNAISVDHLEATSPKDLEMLARSDTFGVALPCSGFQLDDRYAPARAFLDAGGALAIASNYNPGSAPTPSLPFTIALACRKLKLSVAEAFTATTHNAACLLGIQDEVGSIQPDRRANLQMWDFTDERELPYEFATPGPLWTMLNGRIAHERRSTQT